MIKAIVIDDEKNAIEVLCVLLKNYCPQVNMVALCQGGEDGVIAIKKHKPDLIFLDIEMPKVNGFDVLNQTKELNYKVIFTTAYDQFAIKAFKYSAIDYLLKPIDIEELKAAVNKISSEANYQLEDKIESLFSQYYGTKSQLNSIALPINSGYEMTPYDNIIRCESESNYTTIFLTDHRKITLSKTLKEVESSLNKFPFYRIHQSHLINVNHIKKMFKTEGGYVIMSDDVSINIARSKKDEFWEKIVQGMV